MITEIIPSDYLIVDGENATYYNSSTSAPLAGMLRYHSGGKLEVFDGQYWHKVQGSTTISLNYEAKQVLEWAKNKMREEEILVSLPNDNPAIKLAKDNVNRAKQVLKEAEEQLKLIQILSEEQ